MQPNARILETITNRTQARAQANDVDGLHAIITAAERGRQLAAEALASLGLDLNNTPDAGAPTSNTVNLPDAPNPELASIAAEHDSDPPDTEGLARKQYEQQAMRQYEDAAASDLYGEIMHLGGIKVSAEDVRKEYHAIPPAYRRPDGMPGDEMAEHLATHRPELGVTDENSLLAFFEARSRRAREERAAA